MVETQPALHAVKDVFTAPCIQSTTSTFLDLPPSCIEFAPCNRGFFVVGTYNLESSDFKESNVSSPEETEAQDAAVRKKPQSRSGSLLLYQLESENLSLIQIIPTNSAVLDLRFSRKAVLGDRNVFVHTLVVATSAGVIEMHRLVSDTTSAPSRLESIQVLQAYDPSLLLLSLAINPISSLSDGLAVTLSDGSISILNGSQPLQAHSLETWTVAWSSFANEDGTQLVYSGGDDSRLCTLSYSLKNVLRREEEMLHTRSAHNISRAEGLECSGRNLDPTDDPETMKPFELTSASQVLSYPTSSRAGLELVGLDAKLHGAGVTAILPINLSAEGNPLAEVLLTGSYDEYLRILSPKANGKWKMMAEKRMGGGVWRLKYLSIMSASIIHRSRHSILASCMHAGVRIVEIAHNLDDTWSIGVFARLEEHESMIYGSDFLRARDKSSKNETTMVVSTSFYDKKLCVTRIPDLA